MKKALIQLFFFLMVFNVMGQTQDDTTFVEPKIQLNIAYMGDSVIVRWAPNRSDGWIIGMNHGYIVERLELNQQHEPISEWIPMHNNPLKPYSVSKWKEIFAKDTSDVYAMMAAESLYNRWKGEGADINPQSIAEFILESQDFEDRFAICLLASDFSALAAEGMGWRICDKSIQKDKKYLYSVKCNQLDSLDVTLHHAVKEVNTDNIYAPKPFITEFEEKEFQVDLKLDRDYHQKRFTAYYFEKSIDNGNHFTRINRSPYVNPLTNQAGIGNLDFIAFVDTIQENYQPAQYRVIGITPFATESLPSKTIIAMGRDKTPPPAPDRSKADTQEDGTMKIEWEYDEPVSDLNGFVIGRSKKPYENFELLFEEPLSAATRSYIDPKPNTMAPNYYTILATDTAGNASMAKAVFGNYIDSIPPDPPFGLEGTIDTNGVVSLKWNIGPEPDLLGYHVYFNNQADHYWGNVSNSLLQDTVFTDTITLKSLTEKIYYRITALDYNYNASNFSQILELQKPDLIPPAPPTLVKWNAMETSIELIYNKSHSKDIVYYQLLRRDNSNSWDTIQTHNLIDMPSTLSDIDVKSNTQYEYALIAVDDANNSSEIAYGLTAKTRNIQPTGKILSFDTKQEEKSIMISWVYEGKATDRILVYRKEADMKYKLIKNIRADVMVYRDKYIKKDINYKYRLVAETAKGYRLDVKKEM